MNNIGYRDEKSCCYFHPKQVVVGVCPLCLNERLLIVAAKQGRHNSNNRSSATKSSSHHRTQSSSHRKGASSSSIHKFFAFGSLFTRPESHHHLKSNNNNYEFDDVSPSPEESFISIKFEENGVASWEKSRVCSSNKGVVSLEKCKDTISNNKETTKSVIEHGKSRDSFRWRKRIGHVFQLIRWKKKKNASVCHVANNKVEGVKVRNGNWIRTLTKRKATME